MRRRSSWRVVPEDENIAYVAGTCSYAGQDGYNFFLTVQDLGEGFFNRLDTIHLKVLDEQGVVVYEAQGAIDGGNIKIHR